MFEPMQACWFDTPVFYTLLSSEVVSFIWMCACVSSACVSSTVKVHACYQENSFTFVKTYLHVVVCICLMIYSIPDAPCMVYLPTFGWFLGQMLVNIPYMELMGMVSPHTSMAWMARSIARLDVGVAAGLQRNLAWKDGETRLAETGDAMWIHVGVS